MGQRNLGNSTKRMRTSFLEFSTLKMGKTMLHFTKAILLISMIQLMICIKPLPMMHILRGLHVRPFQLFASCSSDFLHSIAAAICIQNIYIYISM